MVTQHSLEFLWKFSEDRMKKFNQTVLAACVAALAFGAVTGEAQAQEDGEEAATTMEATDDGAGIGIGPILGYQLDADDHGGDALSIGVDARIGVDLTPEMGVVINPVAQVRPTTIGDFMFIDTGLNVLGSFDLGGLDVYAGPGLALGLAFEDFADTVNVGLNGIVGANFDLDAPLEPFGQIRFNRGDISDGPNAFMLEVGGHFRL